MLKGLNKNKKYIVLKDGNNYGLMVGVGVIIITLIILFTSKMWLPDSRVNLSNEVGSELFFTLNTIKTKKYNIDYKNNLGEVLLEEEKSSDLKKYDLKYEVFDDEGNKLPSSIITGNQVKESKDSVLKKQDKLIQFGVYKDIYYVKIEVLQKNTTKQNIIVDYRDFKRKIILEKGRDYLINFEKEKMILNELLRKKQLYMVKENEFNNIIKKLENEHKNGVNNNLKEVKKNYLVLKGEINNIINLIVSQERKVKVLR